MSFVKNNPVIDNLRALLSKRSFIRFAPLGVSVLLPILVLGPLLHRGYLLHYDMVFAPYVHFNFEAIRDGTALVHSLPITAALKLMSFVIPMDVTQKLLLFSIFFLASYTMFLSLPIKSITPRILAGLFYAINPFTYDRFMAGHWQFLLAYSLTPVVLLTFYRLLVNPGRKQLLLAVLWWTLAVIISSHHLLVLGLLFVVMAAGFVRERRIFFYAFAALGGVLLVNLWWIIPLLAGQNYTGSFGLEHLYAFATQTDLKYGLWFNMLSLQGFWYDGWKSVKDLFTLWPLLFIIWLLPVFIGIGGLKLYIKEHRKLLISLLAAAILGLLLAAGLAPGIAGINTWLYSNIPGLLGMREPQKFLALLALAYAVLLAFGLDLLIKRGHSRTALGLSVVSGMTIFLMASLLFWGARGQLHLTHYPESWQHFYAYLEGQDEPHKVVVLPWDLYLDDTFAGSLAANPARYYFGGQAIVSQSIKLPGVQDWNPAEYKGITTAVERKDTRLLSDSMRKLDARYIMIINSRESDQYTWLRDPDYTVMILDDKDLVILRLTLQ